MRRIAAYFLLGLLPVGAAAQDALRSFVDRMKGEPASFEYSFSTSGSSTPFSGSGEAWVCGSSYRVLGNGLDIRCDGSRRCTADPEAGEMVIEGLDSQMLDFVSNPALFFGNIDQLFSVSSSSGSVYSLAPKFSEGGIKSLEITVSGSIPSRAVIKASDGSRIEFKLSRFTFGLSKGGVYAFSPEEMGSYKSITDLR